jgi:hypothetical protein
MRTRDSSENLFAPGTFREWTASFSTMFEARDAAIAKGKAERAAQIAADPGLKYHVDQAEAWIKRMSARKGIPVSEGFWYCLLGLLDHAQQDFPWMVQDRLELSDGDLAAAKHKIFAYCEEAYELGGDDSYRWEQLGGQGEGDLRGPPKDPSPTDYVDLTGYESKSDVGDSTP